ncbi:hypothetical protein ACFV3T_16045 [Streptomyces albidoflavus]
MVRGRLERSARPASPSVLHRRYLGRAAEPHELDQLADLSEGFAGSDIEAALHEAGEEAHLQGGLDRLPPGLVSDTFANTVPLSRTNPEQIEEIRAWGRRERALPAGLAAAPARAASRPAAGSSSPTTDPRVSP